jgi:hypothetical protein
MLRRTEKISWTDHVKNQDVKQSQRRKKYPTYNKKKEGYMDWLHLAQELPSKACY